MVAVMRGITIPAFFFPIVAIQKEVCVQVMVEADTMESTSWRDQWRQKRPKGLSYSEVVNDSVLWDCIAEQWMQDLFFS